MIRAQLLPKIWKKKVYCLWSIYVIGRSGPKMALSFSCLETSMCRMLFTDKLWKKLTKSLKLSEIDT